MHYFDLLWRAGHQLHHGVARVDISSAMIFHPVDIGRAGRALPACSPPASASTAHAAAWAGLWGFPVALYQHWNVRTPRWTGWIIQRPEAHMLHHERDVHARNFGDMPIWDRLFGTYGEPATARSARLRAGTVAPRAGDDGDGRRQPHRQGRRPHPPEASSP